MKSVYERTNLIITEFDIEDVITTSGTEQSTTDPTDALQEHENEYVTYNQIFRTGSWY